MLNIFCVCVINTYGVFAIHLADCIFQDHSHAFILSCFKINEFEHKSEKNPNTKPYQKERHFNLA